MREKDKAIDIQKRAKISEFRYYQKHTKMVKKLPKLKKIMQLIIILPRKK